MTNAYQRIIESYFNSWITNDSSILSEVFAPSILYTESHGPCYKGLRELSSWFVDWHTHGQVQSWKLLDLFQDKNTVVAEWYFKCTYNGQTDAFHGVSIIVFNYEKKIISLKEFRSESVHTRPYKKQPNGVTIRQFPVV